MINSQTEEIKSKIDLVDLISEYIQIKQAGANWKAPCPFHNEKTPSFMVSREKQIWHCFGCGEGGDAFSFVQKIENVDFPEALKILAQKAGVQLKKLDPQFVSQKTKLMDITKLAANFFHKALLDSQEGKIARDYLAKRELLDSTIKDFQLGYAPDSWDKLLNLLIKKGFKPNDIFLSGLVVKNEKGKLYDRFRQRLMFPIFDHNSNIVGFTGRILDENKENQGGKYVNTPQTLIYNKSLVIYGLDKAKIEIKNKNLAVIVEGNMDVIASHQANIKNVIASSGTALTLEQLKILKRYTNNLAIAFDADLAGQIAAQRGIDNALSLGMNIKIIQLPAEINGQTIKDPDDCIKQGKEYWQKSIDQAVSIMDFYFNKILKQYDKNDPQDKKEITSKLLKQISKLSDKVEQDHWLKKLAEKLEISENILWETFNQYYSEFSKENSQEITFAETRPQNREDLLSEQILALVLQYPQNIDYLINHLELNILSDEQLKQIYKELILYYNEKKQLDYSQFEKILLTKDPNLVNRLTTLMLLADKDFFNFTEEQIKQEIINIINFLNKNFIKKKIKQVEVLLNHAEKNKDDKQIQELSKDFSNLTQQLNDL
ncbi:MAG: DNA primase [Candidatus Buchananbacteria bacterium]|nr:DNA primase [Candidatus Buchananbacteria bacterium]